MLKSKDKTEVAMEGEEEGVKPSVEDKQPSTSGLQEAGEDNKKEEQGAEKKAKRASRKQVSVEHYLVWLELFLADDDLMRKSFCCWL